MLGIIVFRPSQFVFYFFSSACFFDIISSIGKVLIALILGRASKSRVFEKIYT